MQQNPSIEFEPFWLSLNDESLWREGDRLSLTPKAFAVLQQLVDNAGQLVTRDHLFETIWPDTHVSEDALSVCIRELRQALGDSARTPQYIETVRGRGYRFIAPVIKSLGRQLPADMDAALPIQVPTSSWIIDRDRELAALHDQFNMMLRGDRQLVFIIGEAGIGKTTLVDAFVSQVATKTPLWIGRGQCIDHYGTGEAYLPLLDALGQLGRGPTGERCLAVLSQQAPSWLLQMPAFLSTTDFESLEQRSRGTTQARMLRELAEAVEALTLEQPLVLVLEDLHWSDHATLDWLAFVARRRMSARLFILGTYRPADAIARQHPVTPIVHELQRQGNCLEVLLDYLSETGTKAYLAGRLGASALPETLVQLLYHRTNGNPFFLVTMVEEWIRQEIIEKNQEGWTFQKVSEATPVEIPNSIRHLIEQQLGTLSVEDNQLLERASVAGVQFSAAALVAEGVLSTETVDQQLGDLARRGQFVKTQGITSWPDGTVSGSYGFIHALYQEILYDRISVSHRMRLHQEIGMQLEAGYGEQAPERAAELAVHFEQGADIQRAVFYLQHAGERAILRSAQREAVQWYERALQRLAQLPQTIETGGQAIDIHLALRAALIPLAENEKSFAHLRAAARLAESLGDDRRQGHIDAFLTREWFSISDYDQALVTGRRALAKAHDDTQRISTQLYLSYAYRGLGAYQEIVELLEPVVATLSSAPDSTRLGLATLPAVSLRFSLIHALAELGRFAEGATYGEEAIRIAETHNHIFGLYQAYRGLGSLRLQQGHIDQALPLLKQSLDLCQQAGMSGSLAVTSSRLGIASIYSGRLQEGLRLLEQGVEDKVTSHPDYVLRLILLGEGYGYAGRRGAALALAQEALDRARTRRERGSEAYAQHLLGQLSARNSDSEAAQATACYQQALALAHELCMRPLQAHCHRCLGNLYRQHGQVEKAREAMAMAVELYQFMDMTFWLRQAGADGV